MKKLTTDKLTTEELKVNISTLVDDNTRYQALLQSVINAPPTFVLFSDTRWMNQTVYEKEWQRFYDKMNTTLMKFSEPRYLQFNISYKRLLNVCQDVVNWNILYSWLYILCMFIVPWYFSFNISYKRLLNVCQGVGNWNILYNLLYILCMFIVPWYFSFNISYKRLLNICHEMFIRSIIYPLYVYSVMVF